MNSIEISRFASLVEIADMSATCRSNFDMSVNVVRHVSSLNAKTAQVLLCTIQQVLSCDHDDPREDYQCKNTMTASAALSMSASVALWSGWSERSLSMQRQQVLLCTQFQQVLFCDQDDPRGIAQCKHKEQELVQLYYILGYKGKWYMPISY